MDSKPQEKPAKTKRIRPFSVILIIVLVGTALAAVGIFTLTIRRREDTLARQNQEGTGALVTRKVSVDGKEVLAELASTPHERIFGLMYREKLEDGSGMLFTFGTEQEYQFWMKNMKMTIDIIWINANLEVIDLDENVPPCTQDNCESYTPSAPIKYVLEVPAGWAGRNGINIGDKVEFPDLKSEASPAE